MREEMHFITIMVRPKFSWKHFVAPGLQFALIGVGILTGSTAMQWAAFLALVLMAGAALAIAGDKPVTIAEARAKLDELEAREDRA